MIIENTPYTRAAMALGGAIAELNKAKLELNSILRDFSEETKLLDSLAFQARLVLTVVHSYEPIDPSLEAGTDVPADPEAEI